MPKLFMQRRKHNGSIVQPITAVAPDLEADAPIRIGAKHIAVLDDRVIRVDEGVVRAGLRNRRGCHKSGKGD
jgi:hypothetical protein